MVEASINRQKTDEEMSMAIDNLSAMLNTENVDEVIELLQQNNWDEQAAAQAFYAKQAQNDMNRPPPAGTAQN